MHFSCIRTDFVSIILILNCLVLFYLSLSVRLTFLFQIINLLTQHLIFFFCICPFLSLFLSLVALWHLNKNPLRPETLFVPDYLLLLPPLILLHLTSGSVMIKLVRTFQRTSHDEAFIQNAKSFYQNFSILTFPLSSTVGFGSHCVASRSLVPP